jgi:hypothetical protein
MGDSIERLAHLHRSVTADVSVASITDSGCDLFIAQYE